MVPFSMIFSRGWCCIWLPFDDQAGAHPDDQKHKSQFNATLMRSFFVTFFGCDLSSLSKSLFSSSSSSGRNRNVLAVRYLLFCILRNSVSTLSLFPCFGTCLRSCLLTCLQTYILLCLLAQMLLLEFDRVSGQVLLIWKMGHWS